MYPFISSYPLGSVLMTRHCVIPRPVYVNRVYYYNHTIEFKVYKPIKFWHEKNDQQVRVFIVKTKVNALERLNKGESVKIITVELDVDKITM